MLWFIITLPAKLAEYHLEKAIRRGLLNSHFIRKDIIIYIPVLTQITNGHTTSISLYEGYAFLGLPDKEDVFQFFEGFEDRYNFLTVLRKVVTEKNHVGKSVDNKIPAIISRSIITDAKRRCSTSRRESDKSYRFKIKDRVHITKGVFEGFEGTIKQISSLGTEVFVDIFFLGATTSIRTDKEDLEKI